MRLLEIEDLSWTTDAESDDLGADDLGMPDDVSTDEIDSFGDE